MKKYINRQARDEKRAQERASRIEARNERKAQDQALKLSAVKLGFHVFERTIKELINARVKIESDTLAKLEGDQILQREEQQQKFVLTLMDQYGSLVKPVLEHALALQAAESGLELEEDEEEAFSKAFYPDEDDIVDLDIDKAL